MGLRELMNKMLPNKTPDFNPAAAAQASQPDFTGAVSGAPSLGSGMAQQAAQIMQSRPYQLHVQEAQALGQQPMTPAQFMAMQLTPPRR